MAGFVDLIDSKLWQPQYKEEVIEMLRSYGVTPANLTNLVTAYKSWCQAVGVEVKGEDIDKLIQPFE